MSCLPSSLSARAEHTVAAFQALPPRSKGPPNHQKLWRRVNFHAPMNRAQASGLSNPSMHSIPSLVSFPPTSPPLYSPLALPSQISLMGLLFLSPPLLFRIFHSPLLRSSLRAPIFRSVGCLGVGKPKAPRTPWTQLHRGYEPTPTSLGPCSRGQV